MQHVILMCEMIVSLSVGCKFKSLIVKHILLFDILVTQQGMTVLIILTLAAPLKLGMDKYFHITLINLCIYLSI